MQIKELMKYYWEEKVPICIKLDEIEKVNK
jgi:hypothetical protein